MNSSLVALLRVAAARSRTLAASLAAVLTLLVAATLSGQTSARVTLATSTPDALAAAVDAGPIPGSQRLSLTVTLAPSVDRAAALQQFLSDVVTIGSPSYHKFLTPTQFASTYGATADQIAAATAWAQSQNLSVDAVSPSGIRLTVSAPASTIQSAFAVTLHTYQVAGALYYANATQPSLPAATAALISDIEGLDNLPRSRQTLASSTTAAPSTLVNGQPASLSIATLSTLIDENTAPILTLDATSATGSITPVRRAAYTLLFQQAAAQGITTLLSRLSTSGGIPSDLADLTVVASAADSIDTTAPLTARPSWQSAQGLPSDALRYAPDLTASSVTALVQTLSSIELQRSSARQGNIAPILYQLATTPNLYTQPDAAPAGTWEAATGLGLVDLDVLAKVFPRATGTEGSNVYITSTSYNPNHGAGFVLTATVYPAAGGTPTGTITYTSSQPGFTSATVQLNGNNAGVSPTFQLPGGNYPITATYSGDGTFASETGTTTVFVEPEAAYFSISAPATATLGGPIAITATVSSTSGVGTPTGSVTTALTGSNSQTQTLSGANGTTFATANFTANQAGTLAVTATCTGDASFTCATPQTASINVPKVTPTVTLSLSTTTPTVGASVNYTISVTGVTGIAPTGTVRIMDNGNQVATITLPNTTASAPLAPGTSHSVTAVYPGDTNYNNQTSAAQTATSALVPVTITVTPFPATIQYGQTSTLVIVVAPTSGVQANNTAPSGSVTVTAGTTAAVTSSQLNNGNVNVTLTGLAVGTYPITVSYPGDTGYAAATNTAVTITVTPFAAVITPQLSYNVFTTGSTQTLTVQFASAINAPVPQNAAFVATLNGNTYPGNFNINGGGVNATGQVTIPAPIAGTYPLQVTCVPNPAFTCNVPAPIIVTSTSTVPPPTTGSGSTPTQTTLVSSASSQGSGQSITLTATVTASASAIAANAISGTVNFYDGATLLTSAPVGLVGSNFVASAQVTLSGSATHSLTATYSGNTIYASSTSSAVTVSSVASPAAITLTSSVTSGLAGQSVTLTARVTGSTFSGVVPTGSVTFYLAGATPVALATIGLSYNGPGVALATFTTTGLPAGSQQVYAVYSGDGNFNAITSATISIGLTDYNVTFVPATLALNAGHSGTATLTVNFLSAFTGTISFGCTPPPSTGITCSFSPSTLTGAGTTTLTVNTVAPKSQSGQNASLRYSPVAPVAGVTLAGLLCLLLPGRTRRRLPTLLLFALALALTANLGCSSGASYSTTPIGGTSGTPLGTSILTINTAGTNGSSTVIHNYSFQVTVQ